PSSSPASTASAPPGSPPFPTRRSSDLAPAIFERVEPGFAIGYKPEDIERGRAVRMKIPLEDMVKDVRAGVKALAAEKLKVGVVGDRKSTRLNSSHVSISYAVFCLKKKS